MVVITSKANPIVHHAIELKDKKSIREYGECLVESEKIVNQLCQEGKLTKIIVEEDKIDKYAYITEKFDGDVVYISSTVSEYISDASTSSGIFGFAKVPLVSGDIVGGNAVVLDNLQDPANFGAIVRSALAFGFKDIFLIDSVFPYSFKAIRASMGYVFDVKIHEVSYEELSRVMKENELTLVVADMNGVTLTDYKLPDKIALVIGNEGNGISDTIKSMNLDTISIPMQNNVESLNAGISASILMYYISNKEI